MNLELIEQLSKQEKKTLIERSLKLQEEVGELAVEIGIAQKIVGFYHKEVGKDGIKGEAIDTVLVGLSIFYAAGGNSAELDTIVAAKCKKWQEHQKISAR